MTDNNKDNIGKDMVDCENRHPIEREFEGGDSDDEGGFDMMGFGRSTQFPEDGRRGTVKSKAIQGIEIGKQSSQTLDRIEEHEIAVDDVELQECANTQRVATQVDGDLRSSQKQYATQDKSEGFMAPPKLLS